MKIQALELPPDEGTPKTGNPYGTARFNDIVRLLPSEENGENVCVVNSSALGSRKPTTVPRVLFRRHRGIFPPDVRSQDPDLDRNWRRVRGGRGRESDGGNRPDRSDAGETADCRSGGWHGPGPTERRNAATPWRSTCRQCSSRVGETVEGCTTGAAKNDRGPWRRWQRAKGRADRERTSAPEQGQRREGCAGRQRLAWRPEKPRMAGHARHGPRERGQPGSGVPASDW